MNNKTTEQKLSNIWDGMLSHMRELSEFMIDNHDDPFFETDFGREIKLTSADLLAKHMIGLLGFMGRKENTKKPDLGKLLKDLEL